VNGAGAVAPPEPPVPVVAPVPELDEPPPDPTEAPAPELDAAPAPDVLALVLEVLAPAPEAPLPDAPVPVAGWFPVLEQAAKQVTAAASKTGAIRTLAPTKGEGVSED
jgi:2-oxoglutarate dehydrogenase E2 component (dihydrolipoamide succinyltransferase)